MNACPAPVETTYECLKHGDVFRLRNCGTPDICWKMIIWLNNDKPRESICLDDGTYIRNFMASTPVDWFPTARIEL